MELEGQLSSPGQAFTRLIVRWRQLPADQPSQTKATPPRVPQRAEDRLGPDGLARLCADYRAGQSTKRLQKTYGLSQGAVLRLLEVNGLPRRQRGLTDIQVQEAIELYLGGWSLTRIGDRFGKDHTMVKNALLRTNMRPPTEQAPR